MMPMSDDLRTRIIKAIGAEVYGDVGNSDLSLATRAADAVIRELGMRRESMLDGIAPVDDPPAWHHRYTTDWIADE